MSEITNIVDIATEALLEKKGESIKIIDISEISTIADYFIISNGNNVNQIHTLCDNVSQKLSKAGFHPKSVEGYNGAKWVLMDYGDVVINVFSKEDRAFYDLERIWRDGKIQEK